MFGIIISNNAIESKIIFFSALIYFLNYIWKHMRSFSEDGGIY